MDKKRSSNSSSLNKPGGAGAVDAKSKRSRLSQKAAAPPTIAESRRYDMGDEDLVPYNSYRPAAVANALPPAVANALPPAAAPTRTPAAADAPRVVFVRGPMLNQTRGACDGAAAVQRNIDALAKYLRQIGFSGSVKEAFVVNAAYSSSVIEYEDCMNMILLYPVSEEDFRAYSDMVFGCYVDLMSNLHSLATIAVNVNYATGKSRLSDQLTFFLNAIVGQFTQLVTAVLAENRFSYEKPDPALSAALQECAANKQEQLLSQYNTNLAALQAYDYFKYTDDNDAAMYNRAPSNILQVRLNVTKIEQDLHF